MDSAPQSSWSPLDRWLYLQSDFLKEWIAEVSPHQNASIVRSARPGTQRSALYPRGLSVLALLAAASAQSGHLVSSKHGSFLRESLLAIYALILNRMWEWMRIHALWIMVWLACVFVQCAQRGLTVHIPKTHLLRVFCGFWTQKNIPDCWIVDWNTFWAKGQNVF